MFPKSHPENIKSLSTISILWPRQPQKCGKKPRDLLDNVVYPSTIIYIIILTLILHNSLVKGAQAFLDDMAAVWATRMGCWERLVMLTAKIVHNL